MVNEKRERVVHVGSKVSVSKHFVVLCSTHVRAKEYLTYLLLLGACLGLEARWRQALADHGAAIACILE